MSKRKHFHNIGGGKKMFQYAALDNAGLPCRFLPKKKVPTSPESQRPPQAEGGGGLGGGGGRNGG